MVLKIKRRVAPLDENKKRQRQIMLIAVFLVVAVFFVGLQIGKNTSTKTVKDKKSNITIGSNNTPNVKSQVTSLGPNNFDLIIPTGFSKNQEGAVKAAATYIESWPQLLVSNDNDVIAAIEYVTTPNATELKASLAQTITSVRSTFADSIANQYYHQSVPLKTKINSADNTNVSISLWTLELWAGAGTLEPQSSYDLHELKLVFVDNDWKIDSWLTTPGPTPQWAYEEEPLSSIDFLGKISSYQEYKR